MSVVARAAGRAVSQVKSWLNFTQEGIIPQSWPINYWQTNQRPFDHSVNGVMETCVHCYAQTVAQCPIKHLRTREDGGRDEVDTSAASRLFFQPNDYQTRSDFMLNLVHSLLKDGNAYVYIGQRDGRFQPTEMHLLNPRLTRGWRVSAETREVFYAVAPNAWSDILGQDLDDANIIPDRDIIHVRLHTPYDPLRGVSPVEAIIPSIITNNAITAAQASFFTNMSRPSGILSTDNILTKDQMIQLRQAWEQQATDVNTGKIPILSAGLKWQPMSINSQDAQLVQALRFSVEDISRVYRVPLPMINSMEGSTFANAETMLNWWLASGLGFMLDHIELAFAKKLRVPRGEMLNFDADVLLRTDLKTRIDALGDAVQKGIYAPNEARRMVGLPEAREGDEPRLQQQVVPLSFYADQLELQREEAKAAAQAPAAAPPPLAAPPEEPVEASAAEDYMRRKIGRARDAA